MRTDEAVARPRWIRSLEGRPGIAVSALWGFAEGTLFFVVPDVLFTLVAAFRPARALAHLASATAGALLAGALMFAWSARAPEKARATVAAVPKVGARMVEETDARWRRDGVVALFDRPLGGVPYKVYAVLAPAHAPLGGFLGLSVVARVERFAFSWIAFVALHGALLRRFGRRWKPVVAIHAAFWIVLYGYFWIFG